MDGVPSAKCIRLTRTRANAYNTRLDSSSNRRTVSNGALVAYAKGLSLILLVFFFPLAVYLLLLGLLNRRRHSLLVSGIWDGVGLIFGLSGFLLFAGPAVLSATNERSRMFWLLSKGDAPLGGADGAWQFWIFLSILYFALVVGGVTFYFWRQRRVTAVYNADPRQIENALVDICERLELRPLRSGGLFLFGLKGNWTEARDGSNFSRLQAPHYFSASTHAVPGEISSTSPNRAFDRVLLEQTSILEVDAFPLMNHVTLRWDPVNSPLRETVENELSQRLSEVPPADSSLGSLLMTLGSLLLILEAAGALLVLALRYLLR